MEDTYSRFCTLGMPAEFHQVSMSSYIIKKTDLPDNLVGSNYDMVLSELHTMIKLI